MKDNAILLIKLSISCGLMYLLFRNISVREVEDLLMILGMQGISLAVLVYLLSIFVNAIKWGVLLPNTRLSFLTFLTFGAQFYSTVLPGQLFGETSKLVLWKDKKENIMKIAASVAFDKVTGMIGQVLLAVMALSFSSVGQNSDGGKWFLLLGMLLLLSIFASKEKHIASFIYRGIGVVKQEHIRIGIRLEELYGAWRQFSANRITLAKSILWGMANQLMGIIMVWLIACRLNMGIGIVDFCWIMPALSFVLLMPISFAGIGLRDVTLMSIFSIYGVNEGRALVISSMLLLGQVVASFIGYVMILYKNINTKGETK